MSEDAPGFIARLKRHHIFRLASGYAVVAYILIQVADAVFPDIGLSRSDVRFVIVLVALLFPVALVLGWMFIPPSQQNPAKHTQWQRLHWKLGSALTVVIVALAVLSGIYFWRINTHATGYATVSATPTFDPPAGTLVVLPFTNLDNDPKQQYFSDGITEELTDALGQTAALTVIAWDTASHYRNSTESPDAIGRALNVANLLHGSIQREGDQVRVIAELVNTRTGTQLWSAHYDDSLANIFQVQDKISAAIAGALQVKLASLSAARPVNPEAHDLVLKAHALMDTGTTAAPIEQARRLLEQAVAIAPDYADAHAYLAGAWLALTQYTTLSLKEVLPKVREEANRALALDPRNVEALVQLANADASEGKIAQAKAGYQQALAIDPSSAVAHVDYGNVLPLKQSLAQELEAVQLDPDYATEQNNLAASYLDLGDYQLALAPWLAVMRLDPHSADNALGLALTYALLHRNQDAVKAFDLAQPDTPLAKALITAGRLTYQSVLDPTLHTRALETVNALRRGADLDPTSMSDLIQLYLALGENSTALEMLPKMCAAQPFGCNDLSINPLYVPLRAESHFKLLVKQYDTMSKLQ